MEVSFVVFGVWGRRAEERPGSKGKRERREVSCPVASWLAHGIVQYGMAQRSETIRHDGAERQC